MYAKTGTADIQGQEQPNSWLIAFDPAMDVAVAAWWSTPAMAPNSLARKSTPSSTRTSHGERSWPDDQLAAVGQLYVELTQPSDGMPLGKPDEAPVPGPWAMVQKSVS